MEPVRVLFVCVHNSARSQMAEAFLKCFGKGDFIVESAGLKPGVLNPYVVRAMAEVGVDISANRTKSVQEFLNKENEFDYVITVCDEANAQKCPVFPGGGKRLHWGFPDPSAIRGREEDIMKEVRKIREAIREKVLDWMATLKEGEGYERAAE